MSDPIKREQQREKERRNYFNKKMQGSIKSIADRTPEEQTTLRKAWAANARRRRARVALLTPSVYPTISNTFTNRQQDRSSESEN